MATTRSTFHPTFYPGLAVAAALVFASPAAAATFIVTDLADSGPGSLRQAVLAANAGAGPDEIDFEAGLSGTITLTSGEIAITDHLVIHGPGAEVLTVSGNLQSRIFHVDGAGAFDVTLSGLTLTQGYAQGPGGAVLGVDANLTIRACVISDSVSEAARPGSGVFDGLAAGGNVAFFLGALRIEDSQVTGGVARALAGSSVPSQGGNVFTGQLTLERSTVAGGSADEGGGLYGAAFFGGPLIRFSTIAGNTAREGGGIHGTPRLEASTVMGNTATVWGGGIFFGPGSSTVENSTISGNTAQIGGGMFLRSGGDGDIGTYVSLRLTTIASNTADQDGGNIWMDPGTSLEFDHCIVANGSPRNDYGFAFADYSLFDEADFVFGSNNIFKVDPLLGPLANNGGPTLTHALLPGSPAIDAGDPVIPNPPATDQRGSARIVGARIDLGSVELRQGGVAEIPTLSQVGSLALAALLLATGVWRLRRGTNRGSRSHPVS